MIAGSVADNLGLSDHQLHLIPVENCADCWFAGFRLQAATPSIQAALLHYGIDGDLLEACLKAAEMIITLNEFNRWPPVPVRGFGASVN